MFYELRSYQARSGRRQQLVDYMEQVVIPFQAGAGVSVFGSFVEAESENRYVWIRRFDDEQQLTEQSAAVYESARWTDEIGPAVSELMDPRHAVITRVIPTPRSGLR